MRTSKSILRKPLTKAEADRKFLERTLNSMSLSDESRSLITQIVNRYHSTSYTAINEMRCNRTIPMEVMLDNYLYLMSKVKGDAQNRLEHSEQVMKLYGVVPEAMVLLREAPIAVRRRAVVALRFCNLVEEATSLPEGTHDDRGIELPSQYVIDLGVKNWKRLDEFIDLMLDDRDLELPAIDMILEHDVPTVLSNGAL